MFRILILFSWGGTYVSSVVRSRGPTHLYHNFDHFHRCVTHFWHLQGLGLGVYWAVFELSGGNAFPRYSIQWPHIAVVRPSGRAWWQGVVDLHKALSPLGNLWCTRQSLQGSRDGLFNCIFLWVSWKWPSLGWAAEVDVEARWQSCRRTAIGLLPSCSTDPLNVEQVLAAVSGLEMHLEMHIWRSQDVRAVWQMTLCRATRHPFSRVSDALSASGVVNSRLRTK